MKNWLVWLKQLLNRNNLPRWLVISGLVLSLLGFADASYLSIERLSGRIPPCIITGGCDTVTKSSYSSFGPIPVSVVGSVFYLAVLVLFFGSLVNKDNRLAVLALRISPFGFLFSLYFLFIQAFVLNAYCIYCLGSFATSTLIFALAVYAKIKKQI